MKFFHFPTFILSFAIGIFIVYSIGPDKKEIVIYPSEDTLSKVQYQDDTNTCFTFDIEKTKCPLNPDNVLDIPIQVN
jgi:hypothetical protein